MSNCAYCDIESKTNLTNCVKCDDFFCERHIESLDDGHVCSFCLEEQVEDELDKKELIVDEEVKYLGGHSQYPASSSYKTQLMLYEALLT